MTSTQKLDGRRRVLIENVQPEIDCGRFPIKRVIGERVDVEADVFNDSHDALSCLLRYRQARVGSCLCANPLCKTATPPVTDVSRKC